jgi:DNA-binding winged helix-turn-helix (wHTH) protein/tetratricopeptide (TPR) repeat protein
LANRSKQTDPASAVAVSELGFAVKSKGDESLDCGSLTGDSTVLRFGPWSACRASGELRSDETLLHLEPKVMALLWLLTSQINRVFSREELMQQLWPGVIVGDDTLARTVFKLRKALNDDAKTPIYVDTLAKRGYRFIHPLTIANPDSASVAPTAEALQVSPTRRHGRQVRADVIESQAAQCAVDTGESTSFFAPPIPQKRLTSMFCQGKTNWRPVLIGGALTLIVLAPLSGWLLWSELQPKSSQSGSHPKRAIADQATRQTSLADQATRQTSLADQATRQTSLADQATRQTSLADQATRQTSIELMTQRGNDYYAQYSRVDNQAAIELYERVIAMQPEHAPAYAGLANALTQTVIRWHDGPERDRQTYSRVREALHRSLTKTPQAQVLIERALRMAKRAVELEPQNASSHKALGLVLSAEGDFKGALAAYQQALNLDANAWGAMINVADLLEAGGQNREALRYMENAFAAMTRSYAAQSAQIQPWYTEVAGSIGDRHQNLKQLDQAEFWYRKTLEIAPFEPKVSAKLAALLRQTGRAAEAFDLCTRLLNRTANASGCDQ